jgi:hypothetical protein
MSSMPVFNANREAESGQTWTIPFGCCVGLVVRFGKLQF